MLGALLGIILALATLAPMAAVLGAARQFQIHVAIAIAATGTVLVATAGLLVGSDGGETLSLPLGVPWLAAHFRLDALAAWFLLLVNLAGASAAVYAIGYVPHLSEPHRALPALPVDLETARVHAQLLAHLPAGETMGAHDALIGATAMRHGYAVLTRNVKDFRKLPGLRVLEYTVPA